MRTAFTELVGCEAPIQLAGMGISTIELAVAVARAGGLGTISSTWLGRADRAVARLEAVGELGSGALAVNVLVNLPEQVALIEAVAPLVRALDFFWSWPDPALVERAHAGGALALWQVGSADEARAAQDAGCDVVVAQGNEAGGHVRAGGPLLEVLDDVLDAVSVPVLASGGIGSARRLAAVLAAGASGARVGTRFAGAAGTGAHPDYVAALVAADNDDSVATSAFSVECPLCPSTHRVLRSCIEAAEAHRGEVVGHIVREGRPGIPLAAFHGAPPSAAVAGDIGSMALYAGRGVGHCRAGDTAAAIVEELVSGAERHLSAVAPR